MKWPAGTCACLVVAGAFFVDMAAAAADPVVRPGGGGGQRIETVVRTPTKPGANAQADGAESVADFSTTGAPPCTYRPLSPEEALAAGLLSPDNGGVENLRDVGGTYVSRDCGASGGGRTILWVPGGEGAVAPPGVLAVTPEVLAQEARNTLQLPEPSVGVSPDGANENPALVNLPTWWWVTNGDAMTQRTELGGVWAEVTAEPVASAWVAGDGERSECAGLGIAYVPGMHENQPGRCSHTYARANASEEAQIQVVWHVSWVGSGGSGGTLEPFTLTATQVVPVYERHAIVTSSG